MKKTLYLLLFLFSCMLQAQTPVQWYTQSAGETQLQVKLFLSTTCPFCQKEDAFFKKMEASTPWIKVSRHYINRDKNALTLFSNLLAEQDKNDFAVPSAFFCNTRWTGFASEEATGQQLMQALVFCKQEITKSGALTPSITRTLTHLISASKIQRKLQISQLPHPILYITLVDILNPCSTLGLLGFLALIFMQNRSRVQLITGLLFIVTFGILHYFQQAYAIQYFTVLPWLRLPALAIGLYLIYLVRLQYKHLASPNHFYLGSILMACMVGFYQQSCLGNWVYLFPQWVHNQQYSSSQIFWYSLTSQVLYLLPALSLLLSYLYVMQLKPWPRLKKQLNRIGLVFLILFGMILIIYPQILSYFSMAFITPFLVFLGLWIFNRWKDL